MNNQPWPVSKPVTPVNTTPGTDSEMQVVLASLNNLVTQFNQLVATAGNIQQQILALLKWKATIYPDGGNNDLGYLTNGTLLNWPHDDFKVAAGGNTYLDVDLAHTKTTLGTDAGELYIFGSGVWFDADYSDTTGIGKSGSNLILVAGAGVVLTVDTTTPATTLGAAAGPMIVLDGAVFLNAGKTFGMEISGSDLALGGASGLVKTSNVIKAAGYQSSDGSAGVSETTGGGVFKNGLLVGGSLAGTPGTIAGDVSSTDLWARTWDGVTVDGSSNPVGTWLDLGTPFPGIEAYPGNPWAGSSSITTLGTITSGVWNSSTPIDLAYIASIADQTLLGNNSGGGAPEALNETAVRTLLTISNVENTALSTWAGTANVVTVGTIGTGVWHGTAVGILYGGTGQTTRQPAFDALSPLTNGGDLIYHNGSNNVRLQGNISSVKMFLSQSGDNATVAYNPAWSIVTKTDVGLSAVENTALSTWAGTTNITTLGTVATCAAFTTQGTLLAGSTITGRADIIMGVLATGSGALRPPYDAGLGVWGITNAARSQWVLQFDFTNLSVHPAHLILSSV